MLAANNPAPKGTKRMIQIAVMARMSASEVAVDSLSTAAGDLSFATNVKSASPAPQID